jgi:co-chaperonin GroES (HSP10)|tara:strand:- start:250 stop:510 length:261 start_codon:yes stop_codon:yes gene_type:complete
MKAIGKNIVITPIKENDTKTAGGLLLAENHREDIRYRKAKVITVGDTVAGVKDNDDIYYDRHAGFGIELEKERFKVIKEQDVVIVL